MRIKKYCAIAVLLLIFLLLAVFIIYQKGETTDNAEAEKNKEVYASVCTEIYTEVYADMEEEITTAIEIAEKIIEVDILPEQPLVFEEELITEIFVAAEADAEEIFYPMNMLSLPPQFDANAITADLIYPAIALRSGIEGRVLLELFVDSTGMVRQIIILQEEPQGRGFGEAAIIAFTGRKGNPALINNEPVSARYRYPVTFRIR